MKDPNGVVAAHQKDELFLLNYFLKQYRPNPADEGKGNFTLINELFPRSVNGSKPGALAEALGTDVSGS